MLRPPSLTSEHSFSARISSTCEPKLWITWLASAVRTKRGDGLDRIKIAPRNGQHSGAAKRMADKNFRRARSASASHSAAERRSSTLEEKLVEAEFAVAGAEPGEIKAHDGNAGAGQFSPEIRLGGKRVLGTGEAMGKQGPGADGARREDQAVAASLAPEWPSNSALIVCAVMSCPFSR
jgi:hypothetical protein